MTAPHAFSTSPITHVGYIGLGIMGQAMAANLLKAGYKLTVWNRTASKARPLLDQGAQWADSPRAMAASGVQAILINVSDTPDVQEVALGSQGVLAGANLAPKGLTIIDHSTISPQVTRELAQAAGDKGVSWLDAPVSGGDVGARNGTLSIMVGGAAPAFERCLPLFQAMGKNITHLGPAGMGQTCKACNQIAVGVNLLGVCEAMALAKKSGLDLEKMIQVVSGGAGGSWQLANLGPRIAKGDMAPGFMIDLMLKDLAIVTAAARSLDLPSHGLAQAARALEEVKKSAVDAGRLGTQAMSQAIEKQGRFSFTEPPASKTDSKA